MPGKTESGSDSRISRRIHITGVVQGVVLRPFVCNLATRLGLSGWVLNSSSGVEIEAVGPEALLDEFIARLRTDAPPLARIERITVRALLTSRRRAILLLRRRTISPLVAPGNRYLGVMLPYTPLHYPWARPRSRDDSRRGVQVGWPISTG